MDFKRRIADNLPVEGFDVYANLSAPTDSRMGDYCLPCFRLSKTMKKAPQAIAEELKNAFAAEGIYSLFFTSPGWKSAGSRRGIRLLRWRRRTPG